MTRWNVEYLDEASRDINRLDGSVRAHVQRAIAKTRQNPLPQAEGGYGKPLGNKQGLDLSGLLKIKLKRDGVRIIYKLERSEDTMRIVVIGVRSDLEVYREASIRRREHGL